MNAAVNGGTLCEIILPAGHEAPQNITTDKRKTYTVKSDLIAGTSITVSN